MYANVLTLPASSELLASKIYMNQPYFPAKKLNKKQNFCKNHLRDIVF